MAAAGDSLTVDPVFKSFLSTTDKIEGLKRATYNIKDGGNRMNLILTKIVKEDCCLSRSFSNACCRTIDSEDDNHVFVAGTIFQDGVGILEEYVSSKDTLKVPTDENQRCALAMLLTFISKGQAVELTEDTSYEGRVREWAFRVAQHLLPRLAVNNKYVIASYLSDAEYCPCEEKDEFRGKVGDTSFGCRDGWHGEVDILFEDNLPVKLICEDGSGDWEDSSVSSVEIKDSEFFSAKNEEQLKAQTIVFSFLQRKFNRAKLKNCLVPGIGISSERLYIYFYDSEHDILISSDYKLDMFRRKRKLIDEVVVLLWLTLNYRYFCTGITEEMKGFRAGFFQKAGPLLDAYRDNVDRPMHVPRQDNRRIRDNWAAVPGKKPKSLKRDFQITEIPLLIE